MHSILNFNRQTRYFQITPFTIPFFFYVLLIWVIFVFETGIFSILKVEFNLLRLSQSDIFLNLILMRLFLVQKPLKSSMLGMYSKKI